MGKPAQGYFASWLLVPRLARLARRWGGSGLWATVWTAGFGADMSRSTDTPYEAPVRKHGRAECKSLGGNWAWALQSARETTTAWKGRGIFHYASHAPVLPLDGWRLDGSLGRAVRQAKGSWARHAPRGRCRIGRRRRANCSCGLAPMCERRGLAADVMFEVLSEAAWLLHWAPGKMTPRDAGRCDPYEHRTARPVERAAC